MPTPAGSSPIWSPRAEAGEEIIISCGIYPACRLVPLSYARRRISSRLKHWLSKEERERLDHALLEPMSEEDLAIAERRLTDEARHLDQPGFRCGAEDAKQVRLLLDIHALLWWLKGVPKLSKRAEQAIANRDNEILASVASASEIGLKVRTGRLDGARSGTVRSHVPLYCPNFCSRAEVRR